MSEFNSFSKSRSNKGANKLAYRLRRTYLRTGMKRLSYKFGNLVHIPFSQISNKRFCTLPYYLDDITAFNCVTKFKSVGRREININIFNCYVLSKCSHSYNKFKFKSRFVEDTTKKLTMESISQYKDKEEG